MDAHDLPPEIIASARIISRYFRERNIADWRVDGCASRDQLEQVLASNASRERDNFRTMAAILLAVGKPVAVTPKDAIDAAYATVTRENDPCSNDEVFSASTIPGPTPAPASTKA